MSRSDHDGDHLQNESGSNPGSSTSRNHANRLGGGLGKKSIGSLILVVLAGIYTLARPVINEQFGWNLPETRQAAANSDSPDNDSQNLGSAGAENPSTEQSSAENGPQFGEQPRSDEAFISRPDRGESQRSAGAASDQATQRGSSKPGPLSSRVRGGASVKPKASGETDSKDAESKDDDGLLYGLLREIGTKRYMSPSGLLYSPGSAEGHRLEHLRRHTKDQPSRPGSHGVFDGGMEGMLKTIERAYERVKKKTRTTTKKDGKRTVHTVDMGARVGYVGGRDGNRKRKPMARRVVLVLEGKQVITSYPK